MLGTTPTRTPHATRRRHRADTAHDGTPARDGAPGRRRLPGVAVLTAGGAALLVSISGFTGALPDGADTTATTAQPAGQPSQTAEEPAPARSEAPAADPERETAQASRSGERSAIEAEPASEPAPEPEPVVMPLQSGAYEPTSPYGERTDPVTGAASMHHGTDMAAPLGTPIHAVADGVVTHVGPGIEGRSDMLIIVEHRLDGQTFSSWYNHMYADGLYVEHGQEVSAGEVIGAVGSNGKSTGPHLHLEIHTDEAGTTTDPLAWLAEHGAVDAATL